MAASSPTFGERDVADIVDQSRRDRLHAGLYCEYSSTVDDRDHLAKYAFSRCEDLRCECRIGKVRRAAQRENGFERAQQAAICIAFSPKRQHERFEPAQELVIAVDRLQRLAGADADQRDTQIIAQPPQQVEQLTLAGP